MESIPAPPARQACVADVGICLHHIRDMVIAICEPGLEFDIAVEATLPHASCDPEDLQNAILNLVFNARDAMAEHGRIGLSAKGIEEGIEAQWIEIGVTDNGVGMSPETVAQAFEPYFTTKSEGTGGIGLTMVEQFVRENGGAIFVRSEIDVGTAVTIRLPAHPAA